MNDVENLKYEWKWGRSATQKGLHEVYSFKRTYCDFNYWNFSSGYATFNSFISTPKTFVTSCFVL